jgi:prefoldin subunit 5
LKTVPLDRIIGVSQDESQAIVPLHKELQYRDERIQVLQAEIEQLRKTQTELAKQVE